MNTYLRPRAEWRLVRLYAGDEDRAMWMEAARLDGHRLFETQDEESQPVTVALVYDHAHATELLRLMEAGGIHGSLECMP
jgi:hypothetical protein